MHLHTSVIDDLDTKDSLESNGHSDVQLLRTVLITRANQKRYLVTEQVIIRTINRLEHLLVNNQFPSRNTESVIPTASPTKHPHSIVQRVIK